MSSKVFEHSAGSVKAEANMENAFANSVEVRVTDTQEDAAGFRLSAGDKVFPFDISLYIKGTNKKPARTRLCGNDLPAGAGNTA